MDWLAAPRASDMPNHPTTQPPKPPPLALAAKQSAHAAPQTNTGNAIEVLLMVVVVVHNLQPRTINSLNWIQFVAFG
ncbi:hypothetical protein ACLKA7_000645 [Drosophila subpalustris]